MMSLHILKSEVINSINTLKNDKAHGIDNIIVQLIKYRGDKLLDIMTSLCQQIWETKEWPA